MKGQTFNVKRSTFNFQWAGERHPPSLKLRRDCAAVRGLKHVFLRNEPELPSRNCERMLQGGRGLGCASGFSNSGSFGQKKHGLTSIDMDDVDAMDGHGRSNAHRRCEGEARRQSGVATTQLGCEQMSDNGERRLGMEKNAEKNT